MLTPQEVLDTARAWSDEERIHLIEELLATFDPAADDPAAVHVAWLAESHRRAVDGDAGKMRKFSWAEISREAESRIEERSRR